jgi:Protein of unknown function (DUF2851)
MTESLLHFVWKHKLLEQQQLFTTDGMPIQIIHQGLHNHHSGPDFSNAKIKIGEVLWAGQIELHIHSSDYKKHGHQHDKAYNNVVLHVVWQHDMNESPVHCPTLVLQGKIPLHIIRNYEKLNAESNSVACHQLIHQVNELTWQSTIDRMAAERLQRKTDLIFELLKQNENNWEETFYQLLAKNFGMSVNGDSFLKLAKMLPVKVLAKHKLSLPQLEAMLMGCGGFLNEVFSDTYLNQLQKEFHFLKHKHQLPQMEKVEWKFARMRPSNFPTIKMAQLAMLIFNASHLFSKILATENVTELKKLFATQVSSYWQQHYSPDTLSTKNKKQLHENSQELILINTVAPMLYAYGIWRDEDPIKQRALNLLEQIKAEKNGLLTQWKALNRTAVTAYQSQALIELRNEYCNPKKCVECTIGMKIISKN